MDIDRATRLIIEELARSTDRRGFLRRAGQTAFFALAALASGHALRQPAEAAGRPKPKPRPNPIPPVNPKPLPGGLEGAPLCSPPGPYCNRGSGDLSGCHGGHCHSHLYNGVLLACDYYYDPYPGTGCWTRNVGNGYWTCCDCRCNASPTAFITCGCAQFSTNPWPGIESPGKSR